MSADAVLAFLDRWKWLAVALVLLGLWLGALQASVDSKADKDVVGEMARDIKEIRARVYSIDERQREMFCADKPAGCR